jgi:hypothetical protein
MTDPIPASEIEAIRGRHEVEEDGWGGSFWPAVAGVAHEDRSTLLRALDAATEENGRLREAAKRVATNLGSIRFNLGQGVSVPDKAGWDRMTTDMETVLRAALKEPGQ